MDIYSQEEEYEDSREESHNIFFLFSGEDMKKTVGHNDGRVETDDSENIFYPFIDAFSDGWVDSFVVEFDWC